MKLHNRVKCDGRRVARLRAAFSSRVAGRLVVFVGLAGAAWLAGAAAAHADPAATSASDHETLSSMSSVSTSHDDGVTAESEQAALTPANQLESATASILDVPGELLNTVAPPEPQSAPEPVTASADAITSNTVNSEQPPRSADELRAPAGVQQRSLTDGGSSSVFGLTRQVTDPVMGMASPLITPLSNAVKPVSGQLGALTFPVKSTLTSVAQPVATATDPVSAMFTRLGSTSVHSGRFLQGLTPFGGPRASFVGPATSAFDSVSSTHSSREMAGTPAENGQVASSGQTVGGSDDLTQTYQFREQSDPSHTPVPSDFGITTTSGITSGNVLNGSSPHFSGAGLAMPVHADRNAQVSRVTPMTAVSGQLPDHVEDPVVSPD